MRVLLIALLAAISYAQTAPVLAYDGETGQYANLTCGPDFYRKPRWHRSAEQFSVPVECPPKHCATTYSALESVVPDFTTHCPPNFYAACYDYENLSISPVKNCAQNRASYTIQCQDVELFCQSKYTSSPTADPSQTPTKDPTIVPTIDPSSSYPSHDPSSSYPSLAPSSSYPSHVPSSSYPSLDPTIDPTNDPSVDPMLDPTVDPTADPTRNPTNVPSGSPTTNPTQNPTLILQKIDSSTSTQGDDISAWILILVGVGVAGTIALCCYCYVYNPYDFMGTKDPHKNQYVDISVTQSGGSTKIPVHERNQKSENKFSDDENKQILCLQGSVKNQEGSESGDSEDGGENSKESESDSGGFTELTGDRLAEIFFEKFGSADSDSMSLTSFTEAKTQIFLGCNDEECLQIFQSVHASDNKILQADLAAALESLSYGQMVIVKQAIWEEDHTSGESDLITKEDNNAHPDTTSPEDTNKHKFIPKAGQLFTFQIWKNQMLGYLKLDPSGWATIDEKKKTIFILGESDEGWTMCGESKVEAGRKYILVADREGEDKAYFRYFLSGASRMNGHKCGVYNSADDASFFEVGDGKLVPTSWPNSILNCKLDYDEEKKFLVFRSPESEDFVSVVYKQVVHEPGKVNQSRIRNSMFGGGSSPSEVKADEKGDAEEEEEENADEPKAGTWGSYEHSLRGGSSVPEAKGAEKGNAEEEEENADEPKAGTWGSWLNFRGGWCAPEAKAPEKRNAEEEATNEPKESDPENADPDEIEASLSDNSVESKESDEEGGSANDDDSSTKANGGIFDQRKGRRKSASLTEGVNENQNEDSGEEEGSHKI